MARTPIVIETPRGKIVVTANGKAQLTWNTGFVSKWTKRYSDAQVWLDNEIVANCEPYVPLRTGMLVKTGILGTEPGGGMVSWIAPYARAQYYRPRNRVGSVTGPLRGPWWFERAKETYIESWRAGVSKRAGGGRK